MDKPGAAYIGEQSKFKKYYSETFLAYFSLILKRVSINFISVTCKFLKIFIMRLAFKFIQIYQIMLFKALHIMGLLLQIFTKRMPQQI